MSTVEFTSEVVRSAKFREKMRGYHPDEVDAFLERAAAALEMLQTRLADTTERALKAELALESNSEADESIRRTLTLAQRTAELAIKEATEEADRIRADAQADADRTRAQVDESCAQQVAEATADAEARRSEAEETLSTARAEAASVTAAADEHAEARRTECDEQIAAAEQQSAQRIADAEAAAEADQAARAEAARNELEANVACLSSQRAELQVHVAGLAEYLAGERARVLDTLAHALESFGETLNPLPMTDAVTEAMHAEPLPAADPPASLVDGAGAPPVGYPSESEPGHALEAWLIHANHNLPEPDGVDQTPERVPGDHDPEVTEISNADALTIAPPSLFAAEPGRAAIAEADPAGQPDPSIDDAPPDDVPPSTLLFTLEDELRREIAAHEAMAGDAKPRKSLLGRRRA